MDVLQFYELSIAQLHRNSRRIPMAFRFVCLNNHIKLSVALFSQLYQLGTRKNKELWYFSSRKHLTVFDWIPSSLKRWKTKFFIFHHWTPREFGHLQISWHYWVELKKDGIHPRREEDETLAFFLTMAKSLNKMDITQAMKNVILSWQSHLQAS